MKITIESTDKVVTLQDGFGESLAAARQWEGYTESGIPVTCLIVRIAVPLDADQAQFQKELAVQSPPREGPVVFPLKMVI